MNFQGKFSLLAIVCAVLTACGGGGGDTTAPVTPTNPTNPTNPGTPVTTNFTSLCSGTSCASTDTGYAGVSMGVWGVDNTTTQNAQKDFGVTLTSQAKGYLVITNIDKASVSTTGTSVLGYVEGHDSLTHKVVESNRVDVLKELKPINPEDIPSMKAQYLSEKQNALGTQIGNVQNINFYQNDAITSAQGTLVDQAVLPDGRVVNFWVQTTELSANKVTNTKISAIKNILFSGSTPTFSKMTQIAGQPWGQHNFSNLISSNAPLEIFIANLTPDNKGFGLMGYFDSENLISKTSRPNSNESLLLVVDSESIYLGATNSQMASVMAHELTHMIDFYQRNIVKYTSQNPVYYGYDTAMAETSAMMMEDMVAQLTGYGIENRINGWASNRQFNCDLADFSTANGCEPYGQHGSFGAYLLRKYGFEAYQHIAQNFTTTNFRDLVDQMVKARGGVSYENEVLDFHLSLFGVTKGSSPLKYSYPSISNSNFGLTLNALDVTRFTYNTSSSAIPTDLKANGGTYIKSLGTIPAGTYTTKITLPPKSKDRKSVV